MRNEYRKRIGFFLALLITAGQICGQVPAAEVSTLSQDSDLLQSENLSAPSETDDSEISDDQIKPQPDIYEETEVIQPQAEEKPVDELPTADGENTEAGPKEESICESLLSTEGESAEQTALENVPAAEEGHETEGGSAEVTDWKDVPVAEPEEDQDTEGVSAEETLPEDVSVAEPEEDQVTEENKEEGILPGDISEVPAVEAEDAQNPEEDTADETAGKEPDAREPEEGHSTEEAGKTEQSEKETDARIPEVGENIKEIPETEDISEMQSALEPAPE